MSVKTKTQTRGNQLMRISVPISGVQVFEIDDANWSEAVDLILSGKAEPVDAGSVDIDRNTNNWVVKGV